MKDLVKLKTNILKKRELQLEIKTLRKNFEKNRSSPLLREIVTKTKLLDSIK